MDFQGPAGGRDGSPRMCRRQAFVMRRQGSHIACSMMRWLNALYPFPRETRMGRSAEGTARVRPKGCSMQSTQGTPSASAIEKPQVEDSPARIARAGLHAAAADSSMRRYSDWAARRKRAVDSIPFAAPLLRVAAMDPESAMRSLGLPSRAVNPMSLASTRDRYRGAAAMTEGMPARRKPRASARNGCTSPWVPLASITTGAPAPVTNGPPRRRARPAGAP
jgi:hypothetical protein